MRTNRYGDNSTVPVAPNRSLESTGSRIDSGVMLKGRRAEMMKVLRRESTERGPASTAGSSIDGYGPAERTMVSIVHGGPLAREGVGALVSREPGIEVIGLFRNGEDFLDRPPVQDHVLLYDFLTARADGVHRLTEIRQRAPQARLLIFDVIDDEMAIVECVRLGAAGCLLHDAVVDDVLSGIHSLAAGIPPVSPRVVNSLLRYVAGQADQKPSAVADLSKREQEVAQLLVDGLANKEIARKLLIQPQTVRNYLHLIFEKLDVHTREEAIRSLQLARRPLRDSSLRAS